MRKILFIVSLFVFSFLELSCKYEKSKIVLKNGSDCIVVLSDRSISYFQHRTFLPTVFQNSTDGNSFCSNFSSIIGCYDQNRQDYKVCTYITRIQNGTWLIASRDSCTKNSLELNDSLFYNVRFDATCSNWDSIKVYAEFDNFVIDTFFVKKDIEKIIAVNHPFTIKEEISLLCETDISLYYSESTNEYPIKIDIYYNGSIVKHAGGNRIPLLFSSIGLLIETVAESKYQ